MGITGLTTLAGLRNSVDSLLQNMRTFFVVNVASSKCKSCTNIGVSYGVIPWEIHLVTALVRDELCEYLLGDKCWFYNPKEFHHVIPSSSVYKDECN